MTKAKMKSKAKAQAKAKAKALTGERNLMLGVLAKHKLGPCPALD
jgi:hypothetical protein